MILGVREDDKFRVDIIQQLIEASAALVKHRQRDSLFRDVPAETR